MSLTPAEQKVAALLRLGASNARIATELRIAVSTAKRHVSSMMKKTGATNRTALALELASES